MRFPLVSGLVIPLVVGAVNARDALGGNPDEPLLRKLPPGIYVTSSVEIPAAQRDAIGRKLGGELLKLTNSELRVNGLPVRINVITAAGEAQAKAVEQTVQRGKGFPFCFRQGEVVIEYAGKDLDPALITRTSQELGLLRKPDCVRYRVTAEIATVERADYMACNPLFNEFLKVRSGANPGAESRIRELAGRFRFGQKLTLRNPGLGMPASVYAFEPPAGGFQDAGSSRTYRFEGLSSRFDVPFVRAALEVSVDGTGLTGSGSPPGPESVCATAFWPVDDGKMQSLARQIVRGKTSNGAKAMAILEWLAPGKNLRSSGQTGSRWGTAKVLEQKFGHCWDFSDVFVTLARAAGVPSRQVAGWLYGVSGHVWAEFWEEGRGWQQVDPTGAGLLRCGIYHIPYFASEDGEMPFVYLSMPVVEIVASE